MNRDEVVKLVTEARTSGNKPNLSKAKLYRADLSDLDLSFVNLSGANLGNAILTNAKLIEADLSGADLTFAELVGADLTRADLRSSDLREANYENAIFYGAKLDKAKGISSQIIAVQKLRPKGESNSSNESEIVSGAVIPLQYITEQGNAADSKSLPPPFLPARWEAARDEAQSKNVFPALLHQIRRVSAREFLDYIIGLSRDEGYIWIVYGNPGSGKSAFFHTIEHQTNGAIKAYVIDGNNQIIDGDNIDLTNQRQFSKLLVEVITNHKSKNGADAPLLIVLEERETYMDTGERSAICQALRNVLRSPSYGRNVVFVLPVTESNQGSLFLEQVKNTGVSVPLGQNQIYTFQGPSHDDHVDILSSLFIVFNDKEIKEYGLQKSDLQKFVSSQQTIGQYIRVIREELVKRNKLYLQTVQNHSYRPFSVVICFVNPLPGYRTEPIIKAMTVNSFGRIRTSEILRTKSQKAQRWQGKHQALADIVEALDVRIVEITPAVILKILYAYGGERMSAKTYTSTIRSSIEAYLEKEGIDYRASKRVRSGMRKQLEATNLLRIISGEETENYETPKYVHKTELSLDETERKNKEMVEMAITKQICEISNANQQELHRMFALALDDVIQNSSGSSLSGYKAAYPEAWLSLPDKHGTPERKIKPDIVIDMQDKMFLLEFCWRSEEHFTYADISSYVLRKITDSYANLPLIRALSEGALDM